MNLSILYFINDSESMDVHESASLYELSLSPMTWVAVLGSLEVRPYHIWSSWYRPCRPISRPQGTYLCSFIDYSQRSNGVTTAAGERMIREFIESREIDLKHVTKRIEEEEAKIILCDNAIYNLEMAIPDGRYSRRMTKISQRSRPWGNESQVYPLSYPGTQSQKKRRKHFATNSKNAS